jgi:hypothetical protein
MNKNTFKDYFFPESKYLFDASLKSFAVNIKELLHKEQNCVFDCGKILVSLHKFFKVKRI